MKKTYFEIGKPPAVLYGGEADRVFLYVHGLCGNKEEAERFAEIACPLGWQVLGIDLPEHGGRQDGVCLVPWGCFRNCGKCTLSFGLVMKPSASE